MPRMEGRKLLTFTLFRAQVFCPEQMPLLSSALRSNAEILKAALLEKPTVPHPKGMWHVGNVTVVPSGLYFAVGKQLPKRVDVLDEEGDFQVHSTLVAPNTHAVLDLHYQVLAIANSTDLAVTPLSVARKLQRLLQATDVAVDHGCKISISMINDPSEFVQILRNAAAVTKFQVSYGLPNVWDAEEDFQKPFQETARAIGADDSTATFRSDDLDRERLVQLTKAAAAVGKRAKAWIRRTEKQKPVPVKPKDNPATYSAGEPEESQPVRWAQEILKDVRLIYEEIRSRG